MGEEGGDEGGNEGGDEGGDEERREVMVVGVTGVDLLIVYLDERARARDNASAVLKGLRCGEARRVRRWSARGRGEEERRSVEEDAVKIRTGSSNRVAVKRRQARGQRPRQSQARRASRSIGARSVSGRFGPAGVIPVFSRICAASTGVSSPRLRRQRGPQTW